MALRSSVLRFCKGKTSFDVMASGQQFREHPLGEHVENISQFMQLKSESKLNLLHDLW